MGSKKQVWIHFQSYLCYFNNLISLGHCVAVHILYYHTYQFTCLQIIFFPEQNYNPIWHTFIWCGKSEYPKYILEHKNPDLWITFFHLFILFVCTCALCTCVYVLVQVWRSPDSLQNLFLSFCHTYSGNWTKLVRFGSKHKVRYLGSLTILF